MYGDCRNNVGSGHIKRRAQEFGSEGIGKRYKVEGGRFRVKGLKPRAFGSRQSALDTGKMTRLRSPSYAAAGRRQRSDFPAIPRMPCTMLLALALCTMPINPKSEIRNPQSRCPMRLALCRSIQNPQSEIRNRG